MIGTDDYMLDGRELETNDGGTDSNSDVTELGAPDCTTDEVKDGCVLIDGIIDGSTRGTSYIYTLLC